MKKNRMMRLAAVLLVCVLMTTSVISGTFAKYTTQDSASDTARVAKWGVDVLVSGNLFGAHYNPNSAAEAKDVIVAATANSVDNGSTDGKNIVAPGTKNSKGFTVKLTGTPEVAYTVTAKTGKDIVGKPINEDIFLGAGTWGVMVEATGLQKGASLTGYYYLDSEDGLYKAAGDTYSSGTYYELHDVVEVSTAYYPINWKVVAQDNATAISTTKNLVDIAAAMVTGIQKTDAVNANTPITSS